MKSKAELFLENMSLESKYEFLDYGKDKKEIEKVAKKRGIVVPAKELGFFRCIYAYIEKQNLNMCTLPKEEVEAALQTLVGKPVDFDHFRKKIVGTFLDAIIEDDKIIAYGTFFKDNLAEDYELIKELFEHNNLAVSFEAYGNRDVKDDGSYDLRDISFAGGALLIKTKPAFPGAGVMELAKKERILEFASVMTPPTKYIRSYNKKLEDGIRSRGKVVFSADYEKINDKKDHFPINNIDQAKNALERASKYTTVPKWYDGPLSEVVAKVKNVVKEEFPNMEVAEEILEVSRFFMWDIETIVRILREVDCIGCKEKGFIEIDLIDFKNNKAKVTCIGCEVEMAIDLTPVAKVTKKGRKIKQISKIDHAQAQAGDIIDNVEIKPTKEEERSMKKLMEKYKVDSVEKLVQEVAKLTIKRELSSDELNFAYSVIDYKSGGGDANETSLLSLKGKSTADMVSLVAANVSEEDVEFSVTEVAKITDQENKKVEVAKAAEEAKVTEKAKTAEVTRKAEEAKAMENTKQAKELLEAKDSEIAELKIKVDAFEKAQKEAEEKVKAELIEARRDELGDFGKKLSDEQILDKDKFTIAKQTKMISMLKEGKEIIEPDLSKGSVNKDVNVTEESSIRKRVQELAWSSDENEDE